MMSRTDRITAAFIVRSSRSNADADEILSRYEKKHGAMDLWTSRTLAACAGEIEEAMS